MTWNPEGRSLSPTTLGNLVPERVLFEYEGPRTFTTRDVDGELLLAHQCAEDSTFWRFIVIPFTESLLAEIEHGRLDLRSALGQPRMWLVDIGEDWTPMRITRSDISKVPESSLPQWGEMLYPEHDPLLRIRYVGNNVEWGETSLGFLKEALSQVSIAIGDLLAQFVAPTNPFTSRQLPTLFQPGSFQILILPPRERLPDEETVFQKVREILQRGLQLAASDRQLRNGTIELSLALRSALALAPPEGDLVERTEISGRLLRERAGPAVLLGSDWLKLRKSLLAINASPQQNEAITAIPAGIAIRRATHFWIEAGGMNGTHRNWLEIPARLAGFVAEDDWKSRRTIIQIPGGRRFLSGTRLTRSYGQWASMSRVELPRPNSLGMSYQNQIVHLTRAENAGVRIYELEVAAPGSGKAELWRGTSQSVGQVSATGGAISRQYGFW